MGSLCYFAMGLTKLRRADALKRDQIVLDQRVGVDLVGLSSAISLFLILLTVFFIFRPLFGLLSFFLVVLSPLVWLVLFIRVVRPKES